VVVARERAQSVSGTKERSLVQAIGQNSLEAGILDERDETGRPPEGDYSRVVLRPQFMPSIVQRARSAKNGRFSQREG